MGRLNNKLHRRIYMEGLVDREFDSPHLHQRHFCFRLFEFYDMKQPDNINWLLFVANFKIYIYNIF